MDASNDNVSVWMLSGQDLQRGGAEEDDEDEVTYGLHLDLLPAGSKVGIMINDIGELHYYLNGQDKGCAFIGIPEGKCVFLIKDLPVNDFCIFACLLIVLLEYFVSYYMIVYII